MDEGETHARPWKGGDYPFDAKEIMVQGGSGGGIGCVGGEGGLGPRKGSNGKSGWSQTEGDPECQATGTPQGDSELVYRSSQAAPQHWFPTSSNEWSLWGHPALPWNQVWVRT